MRVKFTSRTTNFNPRKQGWQSVSGLSDHEQPAGLCDQMNRVTGTELMQQILAVRFDGVKADVEVLRHFLRGKPLCK